jgi:hypothetical protein
MLGDEGGGGCYSARDRPTLYHCCTRGIKGQCHDVFGSQFFLSYKSLWSPDYNPKIDSTLVSISRRYSPIFIDSVQCRGVDFRNLVYFLFDVKKTSRIENLVVFVAKTLYLGCSRAKLCIIFMSGTHNVPSTVFFLLCSHFMWYGMHKAQSVH